MVVMGLLGLVVLLMVVRPLVRRMLAPESQAIAALPASGQLVDALAAAENIEPSETARKIDIAQIQGQCTPNRCKKSVSLPTRIRAKPFRSSANG
jgi:flagellar M-ring protein FliF